ncbi:MAG TPA: hypothetical protein VKC54_04635, partial [Patescibacteria group bacterium]|nr:hypothetical protein [Patescibacteria group bacterium]
KNKMTDKDYRELVIKVHPAVVAVTKKDPILAKKKLHAESVGATLIEIPKVKVASGSKIAKLLEIE